jgi:hypothetical protein
MEAPSRDNSCCPAKRDRPKREWGATVGPDVDSQGSGQVSGRERETNRGMASRKVPRPGLEPGTSRSKRGMMSFSPSGYQRKARDLNPHSQQGDRLSRAARPTVSGYLPGMDPPGIEPGLPACRAGVFPLDHEPHSTFQTGDFGRRFGASLQKKGLATCGGATDWREFR